jgi:hypothetical protein
LDNTGHSKPITIITIPIVISIFCIKLKIQKHTNSDKNRSRDYYHDIFTHKRY